MVSDLVTSAYEALHRGDIDALIEVLGDALVVIPGNTAISGDHDPTAVRGVAAQIVERLTAGSLKRELVCTYANETGVVAIFDNITGSDNGALKYHTAEEWIFRDGSLVAWMTYVHEYDVFTEFWGPPPAR